MNMDCAQTFTIIGIFSAFFIYIISKINDLSKSMAVMENEMKNTNQRIDDFKHDIGQRLGNIEGYLVPKKVFHFETPPPDEPKEN